MEEWQIQGNRVMFSTMYIEIITLLQQLLFCFVLFLIIIHMKSINTNFLAFMFMPNKSIIIILQLLHYLVVQHVKNITVWCTWKILHRTDCYKSDFIRKICLCWGKKKDKVQDKKKFDIESVSRAAMESSWPLLNSHKALCAKKCWMLKF